MANQLVAVGSTARSNKLTVAQNATASFTLMLAGAAGAANKIAYGPRASIYQLCSNGTLTQVARLDAEKPSAITGPGEFYAEAHGGAGVCVVGGEIA